MPASKDINNSSSEASKKEIESKITEKEEEESESAND